MKRNSIRQRPLNEVSADSKIKLPFFLIFLIVVNWVRRILGEVFNYEIFQGVGYATTAFINNRIY